MTGAAREPDGYRDRPVGGPRVRTDIVDVYVFRLPQSRPGEAEFLQLRRSGEPLKDTWQPVMGHIEAGESAVQTALRELREEVGLVGDDPAHKDPALMGMWALEQVHPYYVAAIDAIVLSPRFCVQVSDAWEPRLNHEHSARRWITAPRHVRGSQDADALRASCDQFMWPGSKRALEEVIHEIMREGSLAHGALRVDAQRER